MEDIARRRWREFDGPRTFRASRVVFVQNAQKDSWVDLDVYELKPAVAKF
jgi:hypothetical protein